MGGRMKKTKRKVTAKRIHEICAGTSVSCDIGKIITGKWTTKYICPVCGVTQPDNWCGACGKEIVKEEK